MPPAHHQTKVLFVDQGRAFPDAAMGHVRVKHALATGLEGRDEDAVLSYFDVPAFGRWPRRLLRHVDRLGDWNFWSVRFLIARGLLARRTLGERVRADRPDVVHITTDQVALLLGRIWDEVPCVLSLDSLIVDWSRSTHGIPRDAPTPPHLRPIAPLERRALERAPLCVGWTETVTRRIRQLAPAAEVLTLHPGLDLDAFVPRTGPERSDGEPVRVLFVGGRWAAKGGPELVAALEPELGRSVELDVVTTESLPPREGMRVHAGKPGSGEVADLFARADLFCLPTTADAAPWVVLEAMASGLPVISTVMGSIPEMAGEAGVMVEPGDVAGLRSAVRALIDDPARRRAMGAAGRARTEAVYDARQNAPRLIAALREVASRGSA